MVVTPLAANTSSALASAGVDSAWVSMPMNSGPSTPAPWRCSQIAWLMARMCASLKALLKEDPLCRHRGVRPAGEIGRDQPGHVDQHRRRGGLAGERTYFGSHRSLRRVEVGS